MGSGKGKSRRAKAAAITGSSPSPETYHAGMPEGVYATPYYVRDLGRGEYAAIWELSDNKLVTFPTSPSPLIGAEPAPGHDVFVDGAWVGADATAPHLRFTNSAAAALSSDQASKVVEAYAAGSYGQGEAGFASYELPNGDDKITVWVVDDAVRSIEGEPPMRDPQTSPGPLTVMLPEDY